MHSPLNSPTHAQLSLRNMLAILHNDDTAGLHVPGLIYNHACDAEISIVSTLFVSYHSLSTPHDYDYDYDCDTGLRLRSLYTRSITYI